MSRLLYSLSVLLILTAVAACAQPVVSYKDDFSAYAADNDGFPTWDTDSVGWAVRHGAFTTDGGGHSFAVCTKAARGRVQTIEATVTLTEGRGADWKTAGVCLYGDAGNYWHLALAEAPNSEAKRHFIELQESYDGNWLAPGAEKTRLTTLYSGNFDWQYNHPYRLRLEVTQDTIVGTISELDGTERAKQGYKLDNVAVTEGQAALDCGNFVAQFADFKVDVAKAAPAKAKPAASFPPFDVKGYGAVRGKATGFFHVEQIGGRWWLITPKGEGFYAVGTDHANFNVHWCEKLGYAPYHKSCVEKYNGSEDAWAQSTSGRLKSWNFNALGCGWSVGMKGRGLPRDEFISFGSNFASLDNITPQVTWTGFPNVFSPKWESFCDKLARRFCGSLKDDPWVIGYFLDNELEWFGKDGTKWGLVDECWKKPAGHSAKEALVKFLQSRYPIIAAFNTAWKVSYESWDALRSSTKVIETSTTRADEDRLAFTRLIAERYFSVTNAAMKKYDPNHANLGCRFAGYMPPGAIEAAGKYCDVVSVNYYGNVDLERGVSTDMPKIFADYAKRCGRPMMITEWSFPAYDSGLPCKGGAGQRVATQAEKARCFEVYQTALMQFPFMVGSNYFMWVDEPAQGISTSFPEDSNYGLVDVNDNPWQTLVTKATQVNARVYEVHSGRTPEVGVTVSADGKQVTVKNAGGAAARFDLELWVDGVKTMLHEDLAPGGTVKHDSGVGATPGGHVVAVIADPEGRLAETDRSDNVASLVAFRPGLKWAGGAAKAAPARIPIVVSNPSAKALAGVQFTQLLETLLPGQRSFAAAYAWAGARVVDGATGEAVPFQVDGIGNSPELCIAVGDLPAYSCRTFLLYLSADASAQPPAAAAAITPTVSDAGFEASSGILRLRKSRDDGNVLSEVALGDLRLGRLAANMHQQLGQNLWVGADKTESVKVYSGPVRLAADITVAATQGGGDTKTAAGDKGEYAAQSSRPHQYRACYRIALSPGQAWFSSRLLWIENTDQEPWQLAGYYHYAVSAIGGNWDDDVTAREAPPGTVAWENPKLGAFYGCTLTWPDDFKLTFWRDPGANGGEHADIWRDVDTKLAPGQRYAEPQPAAQLLGCRGDADALRKLAGTIRAATRTGWQAFGVERRP